MKEITLTEHDDIDDVIRKIRANKEKLDKNSLLSKFEQIIIQDALEYI